LAWVSERDSHVVVGVVAADDNEVKNAEQVRPTRFEDGKPFGRRGRKFISERRSQRGRKIGASAEHEGDAACVDDVASRGHAMGCWNQEVGDSSECRLPGRVELNCDTICCAHTGTA